MGSGRRLTLGVDFAEVIVCSLSPPITLPAVTSCAAPLSLYRPAIRRPRPEATDGPAL